MIIIDKFSYKEIEQKNSSGGRQYVCPDGSSVPSVTTILSQTKPYEEMKSLMDWKKKVGHVKAQKIVMEASNRGTSMHKKIEEYILGIQKPTGSNLIHQQTTKMAEEIIQKYLEPHVTEVWGSEVRLYYPSLYAGTTDLVGVWKGEPAIIDFKQANKPKKIEWIGDYFMQLAAYGNAHNHLYGTKIKNGVVLMCTPDLESQCFELSDTAFEDASDQWWDRVKKYHVG